MIERGDPLFALKEERINSLLENDETESELSFGSRSFLHRVNDQVRKRQKRSSMNVTEDREEHSVIWECSCLLHHKHLYSW